MMLLHGKRKAKAKAEITEFYFYCDDLFFSVPEALLLAVAAPHSENTFIKYLKKAHVAVTGKGFRK